MALQPVNEFIGLLGEVIGVGALPHGRLFRVNRFVTVLLAPINGNLEDLGLDVIAFGVLAVLVKKSTASFYRSFFTESKPFANASCIVFTGRNNPSSLDGSEMKPNCS